MTGRIIVTDMGRRLVNGSWPMAADDSPAVHSLMEAEFLVAVELLRATPRFWSGAVLSAWADPAPFVPYEAQILSVDGYPTHASLTTPLRERVYWLMHRLAIHRSQYSNVLIGVAWESPRTWAYDSRYFARRGWEPQGVTWIDESVPGVGWAP